MAVQKRGRSWQASYRGPDKRERTKTFARKIDAERWLDTSRADMLRGAWVDPGAGRETVEGYAARWIEGQPWKPQTATAVRSRLAHHILPFLGSVPLANLRPSDLQAWVGGRSQVLAPRTVHLVVQTLRSILNAAVADRVIAHSPAIGLRLPALDAGEVVPLHPEEVLRLIDAMPDQYRAAAWLAVGSGLRQGELFGLTVDRVDFLRRSLRVDRQLVTTPGETPTWATTKNAQSNRTVPLADSTLSALSAHLAAYPATSGGLILTTPDGLPISRNHAGHVWRHAMAKAELRAGERSGWHDLRHFYASVLIRGGISVKEVSARLGHKNATTTLRTYTHLWPNDDERTRQAIEDAFAGHPADIPRTSSVSQ